MVWDGVMPSEKDKKDEKEFYYHWAPWFFGIGFLVCFLFAILIVKLLES